MDEEFHHHLAMRAEELVRRGIRVFDELGFSWLDVKLGVRMLAKYPGLSLVSVIGIAVAIAIGLGLALAVLVGRAMGGGPLTRDGVALLAGVAALMTAIGLLAALGPARRSLAIRPTEALREE